MDWSRQDIELAAETGLTKQRIQQIRQLVGALRSPHQGRPRHYRQALQWVKDNVDKLKGLSIVELRRTYGLNLHWRPSVLYQFLKPFLRNGLFIKKYP